MAQELIRPACSKHNGCDPALIEFLLITDQKDSSRNPHQEVKPRTERHFNEFIPALPNTATVVKNIGDSLMVHVRLEADSLPDFLSRILEAKAKLDTMRVAPENEASRELPVPIRIVLIYLDPREFLHGQNIAWSLQPQEYQADVPGLRAPGCPSWLCGDLFGSNIALAFRASGIPKHDIVVIDDRIIKKWKGNADGNAFDCQIGPQLLRFGPRLAFSPFRGLETLYNFGGQGPVDGSSWESHLFLRMVGLRDEKVDYAPDNKLVLDQQKVRIFTEIVWIGDAPPQECRALLEALKKKQNGADYIRNFGRVIGREDFPKHTLSHDADVILMGAYPNPDAYAVIRRELDVISDNNVAKYAYPVTNDVYASTREMLSAFWVPGMLGSKYLLLFARWMPEDRRNDEGTAENKLNAAITRSSSAGKIRVARCGLVQGNLWDVYALFSFSDPETAFGDEELKDLSKKIQTRGFAAATLKLCEGLE